MIWIAPSGKDTDNAALEKRLRDAADQFRANSGLRPEEYSAPVLGLIFLRFAEVRFAAHRAKLEKSATSTAWRIPTTPAASAANSPDHVWFLMKRTAAGASEKPAEANTKQAAN